MSTKRKSYFDFVHFIFLLAIWTPLLVAADVIHPPGTSHTHFVPPEGLLQAEEAALHNPGHRMVEEHAELTRMTIPFDKGHFNFSGDDWSVVYIPDTDHEQMLVANSVNLLKKLKLSISVRPFSNLIFRYQVYLTKNEVEKGPEFRVYLIGDGNATLIKEEIPEGNWTDSALHVITRSRNRQLLFVGITQTVGNEIVLKNFTQEYGPISVPDRYASTYEDYASTTTGSEAKALIVGDRRKLNTPLSLGESHDTVSSAVHESNDDQAILLPNAEMESANIQSEADFNDPHWFFSDNIKHGISSRGMSNGTDELSAGITALVPSAGNGEERKFNLPSEPIDANSSYSSFIPDPAIIPEDDSTNGNGTNNLQDQNDYNSTQPFFNSTISVFKEITSFSRSQNVFNFFLVIMILSIAVLLFLLWRKRRRRRDDEIPVFTRSATEHGNPAYIDDEIGVTTTDTPANYRSFR